MHWHCRPCWQWTTQAPCCALSSVQMTQICGREKLPSGPGAATQSWWPCTSTEGSTKQAWTCCTLLPPPRKIFPFPPQVRQPPRPPPPPPPSFPLCESHLPPLACDSLPLHCLGKDSWCGQCLVLRLWYADSKPLFITNAHRQSRHHDNAQLVSWLQTFLHSAAHTGHCHVPGSL